MKTKKVLKGFTLVELIVVMAIMSILMTAIIELMKPIRGVYVDSTIYESQRTTQSGVVRYLTESTRYATNIGVYSKSKGYTASKAIKDFANDAKVFDANQINVIVIDSDTEYSYNNRNFRGRLLRSRKGGVSLTLDAGGDSVSNASLDSTRLALGDAYYGENSYTINFSRAKDDSGTEIDGYHVSVSSLISKNIDTKTGTSLSDITSKDCVTTEGESLCPNVSIRDRYISPSDKIASTGTQGEVTWIVFTLPE